MPSIAPRVSGAGMLSLLLPWVQAMHSWAGIQCFAAFGSYSYMPLMFRCMFVKIVTRIVTPALQAYIGQCLFYGLDDDLRTAWTSILRT